MEISPRAIQPLRAKLSVAPHFLKDKAPNPYSAIWNPYITPPNSHSLVSWMQYFA